MLIDLSFANAKVRVKQQRQRCRCCFCARSGRGGVFLSAKLGRMQEKNTGREGEFGTSVESAGEGLNRLCREPENKSGRWYRPERNEVIPAHENRGHRTLAGTSASTRLLWDELRTVGGDDKAAEGFVVFGTTVGKRVVPFFEPLVMLDRVTEFGIGFG